MARENFETVIAQKKGEVGNFQNKLEEARELAAKYQKTNAQVIMRWHIQAGNIVIPGSKNPDHIRDNFALFDFALTDEEMARIAALDKHKRYYTSTPQMLEGYVKMVPPVDEQK